MPRSLMLWLPNKLWLCSSVSMQLSTGSGSTELHGWQIWWKKDGGRFKSTSLRGIARARQLVRVDSANYVGIT